MLQIQILLIIQMYTVNSENTDLLYGYVFQLLVETLYIHYKYLKNIQYRKFVICILKPNIEIIIIKY